LVVRVDADETDVAKIRLGDTAYVAAPAFGAQRFSGNVETGDPAEKVDTRVLETLVSLDGHP
jgi:HlyD family secretion protein